MWREHGPGTGNSLNALNLKQRIMSYMEIKVVLSAFYTRGHERMFGTIFPISIDCINAVAAEL